MVMVEERKADTDLVGVYFEAVSHHPLLTRQDEVRLGRWLIAGREAARELAEVGAGLRAVRRRELEAAVEQREQAVHRLIEANLRLVVSMAKHYQRSSLPLLDLIQEGNLGLMDAARGYDHRRGFRFSTYASGWIRQAILRAIATRGKTIRLPVAVDRNLGLLRQAQVNLPASDPAGLTLQRIMRETGLTTEQVTEAQRYGRDVSSLSDPLPGGENLSYDDVVEDPLARVPFDRIEAAFLPSAIRRLLLVLDEREQAVVRLRYGIDEPHRHTLEEVSQRLQVSRERVRQIENRAIEKLLRPANRAEVGLDALPD